MSQVLEHILTPQSFLRTVQGFLVPGGVLHLDVPNHGSLASLVRRIAGNDYGAVQPTHHLLGYSEPPLRRLLENADFEIVHIAAHTNDDPLFGQLGPFRLRGKLQHLASAAMGRGSMEDDFGLEGREAAFDQKPMCWRPFRGPPRSTWRCDALIFSRRMKYGHQP